MMQLSLPTTLQTPNTSVIYTQSPVLNWDWRSVKGCCVNSCFKWFGGLEG